MEDLETALFCEYIDNEDDDIVANNHHNMNINDPFDVDNYTEDIDIFEDIDNDIPELIHIDNNNDDDANDDDDKKEEIDENEIENIIKKYVDDGCEDNAFLYFRKHSTDSTDLYKERFIIICIKLYISYGILDNLTAKHDSSEIVRLFIRQMYYNNKLIIENYLNAIKSLSIYFQQEIDKNSMTLQPISKILVLLIKEKILNLTNIANTLINAKCNKSFDILLEIIKHLMHSVQTHQLKLKSLINEVKQIKFIDNDNVFDLSSICKDLSIDYSTLI